MRSLFGHSGGAALRTRILEMPNPEYQRLLRCSAEELRERLPGNGIGADQISTLIRDLDENTLLAAIRNLGGHDLGALRAALRPNR